MPNKIDFKVVKENIEKAGWDLLSTDYSNLKSDLHIRCPEGHECYVSYEVWRKGKYQCPICKNNPYFNCDDKAIRKQGYRILALD